MSDERRISEEAMAAFVDRELDAAEWGSVASRIESDPALREEACRLRAQKELIRYAYAVPERSRTQRPSRRAGWMSIAASGALFAVLGWFASEYWNRPATLDAASAYALRGDWRTLHGNWGALKDDKVLVHVSSADRAVLDNALDEIEDLAREARQGGREMQIEIVANGPGLDLLKASDRRTATRLEALRREYPGLTLVACRQSLERRRARGEEVELVGGTGIAPSALHEVIERLRTGWVYVRV